LAPALTLTLIVKLRGSDHKRLLLLAYLQKIAIYFIILQLQYVVFYNKKGDVFSFACWIWTNANIF